MPKIKLPNHFLKLLIDSIYNDYEYCITYADGRTDYYSKIGGKLSYLGSDFNSVKVTVK